MRATDIIRGVLDLIDQVECGQTAEPKVMAVVDTDQPAETGVDNNRFKHIFAMLDAQRNANPMYDNSPNEAIAGLDSVAKDAGGGVNGPKNPADIRSDSVSMYPNYQAKN